MIKKIILIIVFLLSINVAYAQSIEEIAGISPDNPFYGLDVAFDNLRISFSSGINKEKIKLEVAEERLAEYKIMIDKNKPNQANIAEMNRNNMINSVSTSLLNDDEKLQIQEELLKHILTLEEVREKVPEQAQKGINNAIESSSKVLERVKQDISIEKRRNDDEIEKNIEIKEGLIKHKFPIPRPTPIPLKCTYNSDCPRVVCVKAPCPENKCINNECQSGRDRSNEIRQACLNEGGKIIQDFPDFNCQCPTSNIPNSELIFNGVKCNIICNRGYSLENNQCIKISISTLCRISDGIYVDNTERIVEKTFTNKLTLDNYENYIKSKINGIETLKKECTEIEKFRPPICKIDESGQKVCFPETGGFVLVTQCILKIKTPSQSQEQCICPQESIGFKEGFGCDYRNIIRFSLFSIFNR